MTATTGKTAICLRCTEHWPLQAGDACPACACTSKRIVSPGELRMPIDLAVQHMAADRQAAAGGAA